MFKYLIFHAMTLQMEDAALVDDAGPARGVGLFYLVGHRAGGLIKLDLPDILTLVSAAGSLLIFHIGTTTMCHRR